MVTTVHHVSQFSALVKMVINFPGPFASIPQLPLPPFQFLLIMAMGLIRDVYQRAVARECRTT